MTSGARGRWRRNFTRGLDLPIFADRRRIYPRLSFVLAVLLAALAGIASAGENTWTAHGPDGGGARVIAFDPSTPSTIYVGTFGAGVFKTTDSGASWNPVDTGLANGTVTSLAVDPSAPATVYAGTFGGGVFKSTNGGGSWVAVNSGLSQPMIDAIVIHPSARGTVYVATQGPNGAVF